MANLWLQTMGSEPAHSANLNETLSLKDKSWTALIKRRRRDAGDGTPLRRRRALINTVSAGGGGVGEGIAQH